MKNICLLLTTFFGLLAFLSCHSNPETSHSPYTTLQLRLEDKDTPLLLSHLTDSIRYIPLETNDSSLIGYPTKLVPMDAGGFLVLDTYKAMAVLQFDRDGKFVRRIGNRGQAEAEYLEPTDVTCAYGHIYIWDSQQDKILKFTEEGRFVASYSFPCLANYFCCVAEDAFAFGCDFTPNPTLLKNDRYPNLIIFHPATSQTEGYLYFDTDIQAQAYTATTNNLCDGYLHLPLNDTIYRVGPQGPMPQYVLQYNEAYKKNKERYIERTRTEQLDAYDAEAFSTQDKHPELINFLHTDSMDILLLRMKERIYCTLYTPDDGQCFEASARQKSPLVNDIDHCPLSLPLAAHGTRLYCLTLPAALTAQDKGNPLHLQEDDNPVLVEINLKPDAKE